MLHLCGAENAYKRGMSDSLFPELEGNQGEVKCAEASTGPRKLKLINRAQRLLVPLDIEELISADHKARAIWELAGRLDLSAFEKGLKTEARERRHGHRDCC